MDVTDLVEQAVAAKLEPGQELYLGRMGELAFQHGARNEQQVVGFMIALGTALTKEGLILQSGADSPDDLYAANPDDEDAKLEVIVVYSNAKDYPGEFVARIQTGSRGRIQPAIELFARGPSLEDVRRQIHEKRQGLHSMPRHPNDDPAIVETWF